MRNATVLLVDDETSLLTIMERALSLKGIQVFCAETAEIAKEILATESVDVVVTDMKLPGMSGIELLEHIRSSDEGPDVVIITAYATTQSAIQALKLGAADYLIKPFDIEELRIVVNRLLETRRMKHEVQALKHQLLKDVDRAGLVGTSRAMQDAIRMIQKVAPTDLPVLVTGESGTGKELVAKAIHANSRRKDGPFLSLNCAAIPESLLESELFGVERGAFTGADRRRRGLFESASGGTLFLDEVGEMPLSMQSKLLRVLQEFRVRRVGGNDSIPVDVRIITATNRELEREVREKRFREDLYFRINVMHIHLKPLRERTDDILALTEHFVRVISDRMGRRPPAISREAMTVLERYPWPGNVRELENIIERTMAFMTGTRINPEDLPEQLFRDVATAPVESLPADGLDLEERLRRIRFAYMKKALESADGVMADAARLLGMSFRSFRYYYAKLCEEFESEPPGPS